MYEQMTSDDTDVTNDQEGKLFFTSHVWLRRKHCDMLFAITKYFVLDSLDQANESEEDGSVSDENNQSQTQNTCIFLVINEDWGWIFLLLCFSTLTIYTKKKAVFINARRWWWW
jgi:hypothetical protein